MAHQTPPIEQPTDSRQPSVEHSTDDALHPGKTHSELGREETESLELALGGGGLVADLSDNELPADLEKARTTDSQKIRNAADWNGPDDPGNAQNWPLRKRAYHQLAAGSLAFAVTASASLITPATQEIAAHFHVSLTAAILPLTLYTIGLACGPIIAAPISETFGRTIVYRVSAPVFMLFLLGAGLSKSFGSLLVCRLLAGIAGSPVLAVGAGTSADMYPIHTRATASTFFIMMPFLGPGMGPIIGGFVAQYKGWRWTQYVSIMIGVVAFILVLPMQETYKKIILTRRAKKLGIPGPPKPNLTPLQTVKFLLTVTLARPVRMIATEPIVLFFSFYNSFTFAILFAFFAAYPYVFTNVYHFNTFQNGLAFVGILVGVLLGVALSITIDRLVYHRVHWKRAQAEGRTAVAPEHRLYVAMVSAFLLPIGLFWFAWTARPSIHWISPILAGVPFAAGNLGLFIAVALYLIDVYGPLNGASALAANGLMRYTLGAVFPLFTIQMYETLHIGWATSLLGFISILLLPIPFVFYKYGAKIREKSAYDTLKV